MMNSLLLMVGHQGTFYNKRMRGIAASFCHANTIKCTGQNIVNWAVAQPGEELVPWIHSCQHNVKGILKQTLSICAFLDDFQRPGHCCACCSFLGTGTSCLDNQFCEPDEFVWVNFASTNKNTLCLSGCVCFLLFSSWFMCVSWIYGTINYDWRQASNKVGGKTGPFRLFKHSWGNKQWLEVRGNEVSTLML